MVCTFASIFPSVDSNVTRLTAKSNLASERGLVTKLLSDSASNFDPSGDCFTMQEDSYISLKT